MFAGSPVDEKLVGEDGKVPVDKKLFWMGFLYKYDVSIESVSL